MVKKLTAPISNKKFSFIEFEADPQANLLIKKSREKRIEPKVMSLLVLLAGKNGGVVTRQEILDALWPDMVVGEEVISQLIYSLRNALADDAKNPTYIETIPKKGYRFIAKVSITHNDTEANFEALALQNKKPMSFTKQWLITGVFILLSVMAFTWFVRSYYVQEDSRMLRIKNILPITQNKGVEGDFNFHKSHNKMVYVSSQDQHADIYLTELGQNDLQQLTNDKWIESSPLWIDDQTLIYIRNKAGKYQIIRHPLTKATEIIYESTKAIFNLVIKNNVLPEVSFMEYDNYQHNKLHELISLNLVNNEVTYLHESTLNLPSDIRHPVYSNDGNSLYFFDNSNKVKNIVALDLKSNRYTTITQKFSWIEHIGLLDAENLLISGELSATKGIWQLNIIDHSIKSILPSSGGQRIVRALLKQDKIFYATFKTSTNHLVGDIKSKTLNPLLKLNTDADEYYGIYSKDNATIYFVSNRTGYAEIWSYNIETQKTQQISQLQASNIYQPVLSHTEDYFVVVYEKEVLKLSIISLTTGETVSEREIPSMKYPLAWSNDDKNIYISEHNKHVNIYKYDSETLMPTLIQQRAGLFAQESANSEKLMLIDYQVGGLINKNLMNGKVSHFKSSIANLEDLRPGELKVVGNSVLSVIKDGANRQLQRNSIDIDNNEPFSEILMDLPNWSRVSDFSADGSKVLYFKTSSPEGDIMSIQLDH